MVNTIVNKKEKTIMIETDYEFVDFEISKFRDRFHFNFIKDKNRCMGSALLFKSFNGRKYYPTTLKVKYVNTNNKKIKLSYE